MDAALSWAEEKDIQGITAITDADILLLSSTLPPNSKAVSASVDTV